MSDTGGSMSTAAPPRSTVNQPVLGRDRLARLVIVGSFLTLFLLVGTLIALAQSPTTRVAEAAEKAFNAILPVLAGWVGTVLAFYFSAASQERITATLDRAISQSSGSPVGGTLVSERMKPLSSILELQELSESRKPDTIKLTELQDIFRKPQTGSGPITRLIFVERGVFRYILHSSTLNAFILGRTSGADPVAIDTLTFADILADTEAHRQISKLVVFVSASATLADAKAALDSVSAAQDIIVTGSGNASAPMLGWLSNVDLIKAMTVS